MVRLMRCCHSSAAHVCISDTTAASGYQTTRSSMLTLAPLPSSPSPSSALYVFTLYVSASLLPNTRRWRTCLTYRSS